LVSPAVRGPVCVVGKSGVESGEAFTVSASCCCEGSRKKRSTGTEIGARIKELFRRTIQKGGGVFAIYLEQSDADGDALLEKPFRPHDRLCARCRLSFKGDRAAIPSLAVGDRVGTSE
jgi:hypothetical protein